MVLFLVCVCVLVAPALCVHIPENPHLTAALHHYEVLHVDELRHSVIHDRSDTTVDYSREIHFSSFGRDFDLHLVPRSRLFYPGLEVNVVSGNERRRPHPFRFDHFLEGSVVGEPDSWVTAHFNHSSGVLSASIASRHEHYFIEPSHRHFRKSHDFHMITYRASDLKRHLNKSHPLHFCGATDLESHSVQSSVDPRQGRAGLGKERYKLKRKQSRLLRLTERERLRRAPVSGDSCPLHLLATHQFYDSYLEARSIDEVVLFMVQVIDVVDRIFRSTAWNRNLQGLGFFIRNVTVHDTQECSTARYNCPLPWDSSTLLRAFSMNDWTDFCLAHLFTANLLDELLGVAYVASSNSDATGGICSDFTRLEGEDVTPNVGLSSYLNAGRPRLLLAEAVLVTAHELGHNWGSEHDPTDATGPCNPPRGSRPGEGKYLMFPSATDGSEDNNDRFSNCSREMVAQVVLAKGTCFESIDEESNCGNYVVDEGEECDAGVLGSFERDPCCLPNCRLRDNAICSDINHPCCVNCTVTPAGRICQMFSPGNRLCLDNIACNGNDFTCPNETLYVNVTTSCGAGGMCFPPGTTCGESGPSSCEYDNSVMNGDEVECIGFCELQGMMECFCSGDDECFFCCRGSDGNGNGTECRRTGGELPFGTTCVGGFCDQGMCVAATQDLVTRLFSLFSDFSANAVWVFISENIVGSVCIITGLIWIPVGFLIHRWDVYRWREHKRMARRIEEDRALADEEDDEDIALYEDYTTFSPDLISPDVGRGLRHALARTDSLYSDFFGLDEPLSSLSPVSPSKSPTRPYGLAAKRLSTIQELEESGRLDPEKHNILEHLGTSPRGSFDDSVSSTRPLIL